MSRLPTLSARRLISALRRAGFVQVRQVGSHLTLRHETSHRTTTVPVHGGDLKRQLVLGILKQAGLTPDDLLKYL